jgi:dihydroneopterin aldolase / 2-amino-4-hydroxy-6-hydroxymethyldihydropteridine diphosphokinase
MRCAQRHATHKSHETIRRMDKIELRCIRAVGIIGVLSEERRRAQPFEIDLDIELDLSEAGRSDNLEHTLNYGPPLEMVQRIVAEEGHELLERVATRILEEVLVDPRVHSAEVCVRKVRPPVPVDVATTAIRMRRGREELESVRRAPVRAILALGSNVGDRRANLVEAIRSTENVVAVSGCYETEFIGGPGGAESQVSPLNVVVAITTRLDPFALLAHCHRLERAAGRVRTVRNGPRTLDVDILFYGDVSMTSEELTIPHPRIQERRFVLRPLCDIAPELADVNWDTRLPPAGVDRVEDLDWQ